MWDEENLGKALCSACAPTHYKGGKEVNEEGGKWHGEFDRMFLPKGQFETNDVGNLCHKETKDDDVKKWALPEEEGYRDGVPVEAPPLTVTEPFEKLIPDKQN